MGLLRRPTPGEIVEGGRLGRPCGPGAHSRASRNQRTATPPFHIASYVAERRGWTISLAEPAVRTGRVDRPEVEVLASVETFWRLVDGSYSPVEAWRDGRLRIRGDEQLGKRVLRHLAGPEGKVDCI
jgi:hypothetical protein